MERFDSVRAGHFLWIWFAFAWLLFFTPLAPAQPGDPWEPVNDPGIEVQSGTGIFNSRTRTFFADVTVRNRTSTPLQGELRLVVESANQQPLAEDGLTASDGRPYYLLATGTAGLPAGATVTERIDFRQLVRGQLIYGVRLERLALETNAPPVADAGNPQTVRLSETVTLNGSGSYDADGDTLSYLWTLLDKPVGSTTSLDLPTAVAPTFFVDRPGEYRVILVVNDGQVDSAPDTVTISTANSAPVADAGPDQTARVTDVVELNGTGSTDVDGDPLAYQWTLVSWPEGSNAAIVNSQAPIASLQLDLPGSYIAELIVNDGQLDSPPDRCTISTENSPPVADAGEAQSVQLGGEVLLDGSGSYDVDGDGLTFWWSFTSIPEGSAAQLTGQDTVAPGFQVDLPGQYVIQLIVNDGAVDSAPATVTVGTLNSTPVANAGEDQTALVGAIVELDGSRSYDPDGDDLTYRWSLITRPEGSVSDLDDTALVNPQFIPDTDGLYVAQLIVCDGATDSDPDTTLVTVEVVLDSDGDGLSDQDELALGTKIDDPDSDDDGLKDGDEVHVYATDPLLADSDGDSFPDGEEVAAGANANDRDQTPAGAIPPDPAAVAPPIDGTVVTTTFAATEFLYTGPNPIQTGVDPATIEPERVAVLRGKVSARDGTPLPGVTVTVLGHPEYGQTLSRHDGRFDLAVNGGGRLTVNYRRAGFLIAQRSADVPWQNFAWMPDVVLIGLDPLVNAIDLSAPEPIQVARGSLISDGDGIRRSTLLVPRGTAADLMMPDGSSQPIVGLSIRATEYTVGVNGHQAMPAELPPTSGYTYAVELTADEAIAAGAVDVRFSQPLWHYVENFIGFPTGTKVPVGYYDREDGRWIPSEDGRVIAVLGLADGLATLDTTGDGVADNGVVIGVTEAEREKLAALYPAGTSVWRVPVTHFTPWDHNWPWGPPAGSPSPTPNPPTGDDKKDDPCKRGGSIIDCENQTLRVSLPLTGAPMALHYASDRVEGRSAGKRIEIPLIGSSVPADLKGIELEVTIAGKKYSDSFAASPNATAEFIWDGLSAYGRKVQGVQTAAIRIGYVYDGVYQAPQQLDRNFGAISGVLLQQVSARIEAILWSEQETVIGTWDARTQGLGGWDLSPHHAYDPVGRILYHGDGTQRSAVNLGEVITTVAGNGDDCQPSTAPCGDGGPATEAQLWRPQDLAVGPDGSIYISDPYVYRIRKIAADGIISSFAGDGHYCPTGNCGDGGPATRYARIWCMSRV